VLDPTGRKFAHRSGTDDGNPSYAHWSWTVVETTNGCEVIVSWTVNLRTFWRRVLFARVRARLLRHTVVPASLGALQELAERTRAGA